ncbi:MAG: dNTP triphosphohydrolase [Epsilonproteobacteria bacterium]|nr:dNTP triphosphohydrolase [Campylobacterota bacterium]
MKPYERFYPFLDDFRDPYSRDRDRIIHSSSFRRLEYKTQVFINHEGDYFRTRLTHSLEVSQIARTLSRELGLNETLTEAIALAHDLGHTPFGHSGGDELDKILKEKGNQNGFEHNFQSFRILTSLEKRYKEFRGLNLTYATLEGVLKHSYPYKKSFHPKWVKENFNLDYHPSLEAIVVDNADTIAYVSHDIDDGIKYNLISFEDFYNNPLAKRAFLEVEKEGISQKDKKIFRHRFVAAIIKILVVDFIQNSKNSPYLKKSKDPLSSKILADKDLQIGFSKEIKKELSLLKKELHKKLYKHPNIVIKMEAGKKAVRELFLAIEKEPNILPIQWREELKYKNKNRVIADYIASMTDRFAIKLYHEIYGINLR